MSSKVTLDRLVLAINKLGFAVALMPLPTLEGAAAPAPAKSKGTGLAARIGADAPDVETVTVHGVSITRVVGSKGPDAPLGRGIDGAPLAPFGMLSDGSRPRKSPAGRPLVAAAPAPKPAPAPKAKPAAPAPVQSGGFSLDFGDLDLGGDLGIGFPAAPPPAPAPAPEADDVLDDLESALANM